MKNFYTFSTKCMRLLMVSFLLVLASAEASAQLSYKYYWYKVGAAVYPEDAGK